MEQVSCGMTRCCFVLAFFETGDRIRTQSDTAFNHKRYSAENAGLAAGENKNGLLTETSRPFI
jgi:hypothetical protein